MRDLLLGTFIFTYSNSLIHVTLEWMFNNEFTDTASTG